MELSCARLNCGESAAASVQFDAEGSRVILIDLTDRTAGIPVCRGHARTRTAPMGWTLSDERSTRVHQQVIWDAVSDRPVQEREPALAAASSSSASTAPSSTATTAPASSAVAPPRDPRFRWERVGSQGSPTIAATSPLLSRAFRTV